MKERTINGHSFDECIRLLQCAPDKVESKKNYSYVGTEEYKKRMNSVLGIFHYHIEYSKPILNVFPNGQICCMITCKITIIDDNGEVACIKSGAGSTEVIRKKETDYATNLTQEAANAAKCAFKEACKELCIFGYNTANGTPWKEGTQKSNSENRNRRNGNNSSSAPGSSNSKTNSKTSDTTQKGTPVIPLPEPVNTCEYTVNITSDFKKMTDAYGRLYYLCNVTIQGQNGGYSTEVYSLALYEYDVEHFKEQLIGIQDLLSTPAAKLKPFHCKVEKLPNVLRLIAIKSAIQKKGGD